MGDGGWGILDGCFGWIFRMRLGDLGSGRDGGLI